MPWKHATMATLSPNLFPPIVSELSGVSYDKRCFHFLLSPRQNFCPKAKPGLGWKNRQVWVDWDDIPPKHSWFRWSTHQLAILLVRHPQRRPSRGSTRLWQSHWTRTRIQRYVWKSRLGSDTNGEYESAIEDFRKAIEVEQAMDNNKDMIDRRLEILYCRTPSRTQSVWWRPASRVSAWPYCQFSAKII